jgi:hypothetical protein
MSSNVDLFSLYRFEILLGGNAPEINFKLSIKIKLNYLV